MEMCRSEWNCIVRCHLQRQSQLIWTVVFLYLLFYGDGDGDGHDDGAMLILDRTVGDDLLLLNMLVFPPKTGKSNDINLMYCNISNEDHS